ncbi:MAG TPA: hypothetical protein VIS72_03085 [Anaerolineales bacterium]
MSKQPAGFVSANYKVAGRILFFVGIISLLAKGVDYFTGWFSLSNIPLFFGIACIAFSLYLIYYIVPRER